MASLHEKVAKLEKQLQQAKALAARKDAIARAKEKSAHRKLEDKRKILLGAFVLDYLKSTGSLAATFGINGVDFDPWLIRDADRSVFGLKPLNTQSEAEIHA